jgi:hypothetical protein
MLGRGCRGAPSEARDDWRYRAFWIVHLEGALLATPSADRSKGHSTAAGRQPRQELQAAPLQALSDHQNIQAIVRPKDPD